MKIKKLIIAIAVIFYSINSFSASDIYFSKIGVEQGLSQLSVMSIYQDELGTIWFATREGLNRYNGNGMEVFRPILNDSNSLSESLILKVCGDKNGHVYIHTQNGVNVYDLRTETMRVIQRKQTGAINYGISNLWIAESNSLYFYRDGVKTLYCKFNQSKISINKILQTSDQRIFIGTLSSGVFVIDHSQKMRSIISNTSEVSDIFEDSKKNIWVSTWQSGLYKIERNGNVVNYRQAAKKSEKSIASNFVRSVCEDNSGFLWIGTKKGLDRFTVGSELFKHYDSEEYNNRQLSNESVWSLLKDSQGTIWVGTYFGGVNFFNPEINFYTFHNLQKGFFQNKPFPIISDIIEDKKQNLFLCTEGNGLVYCNLKDKSYHVFKAEDSNPNSLTNDNIKTAYYDTKTDELWLGTHLGGLSKLNTATWQFTQYKNIKPEWQQTNIIRSILPYMGNLLIATYNGLFLFDKPTGKFSLFSAKLQKSVSYNVDAKMDRLGNLWIASINGVYRYDIKNDRIKSFFYNANDTTSLSNNNATKILIDSKNRVWIATSGGGINLFLPKTNSFKHYDSKHSGLKNDFVSNLLESPFGNIIITTTQGFSMLDPKSNKLNNYGAENGFPLSSLYNGGVCITNKGEMYLAGMNGMVSFYESNLSIPHRLFNLNLVKLWINNKLVKPDDDNNILETSLPYTKSIKLNYKQTMLTLEFASNNYILANQPTYRYRLEGFSNSWTELPQGISKLNFMNLAVGKYKLVIQAFSPLDGLLIASTDLNLQINPPFYFAWYAYLFYILLIIFIIWRYIVFSRSRLLLEASLTYEKKEKEHLEEVNQSKLRFFTNISHEFRTPLTLISGQVDMLLQVHNIQPSIYNRILNIKRNTLNMSNLINELLEFRKSEQGHLNIKVFLGDIVKFLYEIFLSFSEYANYRQIKFNFECKDQEIMLWFDPVQMQKVFYNLISNGFKYTPKDGVISIVVTETEETVEIQIVDNGIGITADAIERIFDSFYQAENGLQISNMLPGTGIGLALTKNILETHSAEIHVESQPQLGSCFAVTLKKGSAHFAEEQIAKIEDVDRNSQVQQIHDLDAEFMHEIISLQVVDKVPEYSILIVEDNDELRAMLQNIFEPIYTIYTAVDGEEGLALTIQHQPDIVLSDLMMPKMSGSEMCMKIKNNFAVCHIPVVLLTAQTSIENNIEGLRLGADDYITKPFNVKILITRCNNLVNGRKVLQEKFSKQTDFAPRLIATNNLDRDFLEKAQEIIEKNLDNAEFDVPFFSREMALGRTKLFSKIKGITGQTPNDFIITIKMKKAAALLNNNPEYNISDITYMLGFSSPKYFAKCFKEQFGVSPSTFRKGEESTDETDENIPDV
jgi:signal transduction histidine kinase/ligand-binding sensor domain-containing protein/DNA-binding response OmpR family regulator